MPKPAKGPRLGGSPSHERHMLNNLAQSLFEHGSITTTVVRAKRVQPHAERLVQLAKRGDLAARRRVLRQLSDKSVVASLFEETAPKMTDRNGGYTRITKVGNRKGDNAPMAVIELVREPYSPKQATVKEAEAATKRSAADSTAAEETVVATDQETAAVEPEITEAPVAEGPAGAEVPAEDEGVVEADAAPEADTKA